MYNECRILVVCTPFALMIAQGTGQWRIRPNYFRSFHWSSVSPIAGCALRARISGVHHLQSGPRFEKSSVRRSTDYKTHGQIFKRDRLSTCETLAPWGHFSHIPRKLRPRYASKVFKLLSSIAFTHTYFSGS